MSAPVPASSSWHDVVRWLCADCRADGHSMATASLHAASSRHKALCYLEGEALPSVALDGRPARRWRRADWQPALSIGAAVAGILACLLWLLGLGL